MALAARGSRRLGEEVEQIEDVDELARVQEQARKVRLKATVAGLLMTLPTVLLPL